MKTIAFPSISTGAYRYPVEKASRIALVAIRDFLEKEDSIEKVIFVLFSRDDLEIYKEVGKEVIGQHR
jgi:O-acetyl-ADP-ribose deacetylase (regulator of RNase III)